MKRFSILLAINTLLYGETNISTYKHLIATTLFSANNHTLHTGWYTMNGAVPLTEVEMNNANFTGTYLMGEKGDTYRPFIMGGFGLSDIDQRDTQGVHTEYDSQYLQIGGGMGYIPHPDWMFSFGASFLRADSEIQEGTKQNSYANISDLFGTVEYHTVIHSGYEPFTQLTIHHLQINYAFNLPDTKGWSGDAVIGCYTPVLTTWYNLPVRLKFSLSGSWLDHQLDDAVLFSDTFSASSSLLWKIGSIIPYMKGWLKESEVGFNLRATTGNHQLRGWKTSISLHLPKF